VADICDIAQEDMEREAPRMLAAAKKRAGPQPTGTCHNCGEPVFWPNLFCDLDCRGDWEKRDEQQHRHPQA